MHKENSLPQAIAVTFQIPSNSSLAINL